MTKIKTLTKTKMFKEKRMAYKNGPEKAEPQVSRDTFDDVTMSDAEYEQSLNASTAEAQDQLLNKTSENLKILSSDMFIDKEITKFGSLMEKQVDIWRMNMYELNKLLDKKASRIEVKELLDSFSNSKTPFRNQFNVNDELIAMCKVNRKFEDIYVRAGKDMGLKIMKMLTKYGYDDTDFFTRSPYERAAKAQAEREFKNERIEREEFNRLMHRKAVIWEKNMNKIEGLCLLEVSDSQIKTFINSLINDSDMNKLNNELMTMCKTNKEFENSYVRAGEEVDDAIQDLLAKHGYSLVYLMTNEKFVTLDNSDLELKKFAILIEKKIAIWNKKMRKLKKLLDKKASREEIEEFVEFGLDGIRQTRLDDEIMAMIEVNKKFKNVYESVSEKRDFKMHKMLDEYGYYSYEFPLK